MTQTNFPYLTVIVLLPLIAGVALAFLPIAKYAKYLSIGVSTVTGILSLIVMILFKTGDAKYQFVTDHSWVSSLGIGWHFGVDGISLFLVEMVALLFPIILIATQTKDKDHTHAAWLLILEGACLGSFLSMDLFGFFVFFEVTLIPAYFLIVGWGGKEKSRAALKFFLYTLFGSAFLFASMVVLVAIHEGQTGVFTFDITKLAHTKLSYPTQVLLFLGVSAAFVVKTPIFPFHTWSPKAYSEAPTSGSISLASIMAKLGTYGLLRFDLNFFPQASYRLAPLLLTLGVIGIIYGAVVAAVQRDFKRLVAFSSLSHLGFVAIGIFAFSTIAMNGAILQMFNHGILTASMFLIIGMIIERTKTFDISRLSGLQKAAPILSGVMMVVILASLGLPGTNGFVGEFLILSGTFIGHRWWAVVGVVGVILSAVYLLWAYQRAFHRKAESSESSIKDMTLKEKLYIAPLILVIFFVGIFPSTMLNKISPSVNLLVHNVQQANHSSPPASYTSGLNSHQYVISDTLSQPTNKSNILKDGKVK
jgi:NADH-quinone oxidoreductase subunit M